MDRPNIVSNNANKAALNCGRKGQTTHPDGATENTVQLLHIISEDNDYTQSNNYVSHSTTVTVAIVGIFRTALLFLTRFYKGIRFDPLTVTISILRDMRF